MMTVSEVITATGGRLLKGKETASIRRFSIDSRTLRTGDIFVALKGPHYDGHDFIKEAIKRGARGIIVHSPQTTVHAVPIVIKVNDTTKALGDIAHYKRDQSRAAVVAITGSNGKTTTKEMIAAILKRQYGAVLCSRGNENNAIGLPLTLLRLKNEKMCVLEMGMSRFGEIDYLARIARPTIGVITNIGLAHLEHLGDVGDVLKAKLELATYMNESNTLVINGDDPHLNELKNTSSPLVRFGLAAHNEFRATAIAYEHDGWKFRINNVCDIQLNLLGRHNIYNALAAIAVGRLAGVDYATIAAALRNCRLPERRLEPKEICGVNIIDDTYNSNPASLKYAIETLQGLPTKGRRILISGDMLELGKKSPEFHAAVADMVTAAEVDILITVGRHSRRTNRAALKKGMKQGSLRHFDKPDEAGTFLSEIVKQGDIVLVKGSRGVKMEEAIRCFTTSCTL